MWALAAVLVPVVAALIAGAIVLWPDSSTGDVSLSGITGDVAGTQFVTARTESVTPFSCQGVGSGPGEQVKCAHLTVLVTSGSDRGTRVKVDVDPPVARAGVKTGDELRLARFRPVAGSPPGYAFVDFTRDRPLALLGIALAVLVVAVARIRGLAALVGLAVSFAVLIKFMIPALLTGEHPVAVALVGCSAIMFVLLYLAHGISIRTTTAHTQASAVWELRALSQDASARRLFTGAMRIGRDHIASSVYTIVFAYAGSALPVLLLINLSDRPLNTILTGEALGQEIVRTLVGSIGLVLAVPLTTAVGVALVRFARGTAARPGGLAQNP